MIHGCEVCSRGVDRLIVTERAAANSTRGIEFNSSTDDIRCIAGEIIADVAQAIGGQQAGFVSHHGHGSRGLNLAQNHMPCRLQCNRSVG